MPGLERRNYYLAPAGVPTEELLEAHHAAAAPDDVRFLNHDHQLFQIENAPSRSMARRETKSRTAAPKPAPVWSTKKALTAFAPSYAETCRCGSRGGGLQPHVSGLHRADVYRLENSESVGEAVSLRPHQESGLRDSVAPGGPFAFDVGVGKTFTGIATVAKLREEKRGVQ